MSSTNFARAGVIIASCCTCYCSLGVANSALGPLLPELAGRTGIPIAQAGLILSFYYLGGLLSRMIAGMLSDRYGPVPIVLGGLSTEACAAIVFTLGRSAGVLYASSLMVGMASGSTLLGAMLIAAKLFPSRSVAALNLVNVFWGVGSLAGPALFSAISLSLHSGLPVIWIAAAIAVVAIQLLLYSRAGQALAQNKASVASAANIATGADLSRLASLLRVPAFWLFGSILLFDVGTESTIGGWTAVYLHRAAAVNLQTAALVVSGFYVCFTLGRLIAAGASSFLGPRRMLSGGLLFALIGIGLVSATSGHLVLSIVGFLLAGFGIAPIYPTITAFISLRFGSRAGTAVGLAGSLAFTGGVLFPWIAGNLMPVAGDVAAMWLVELLLVLVALLSYLTIIAPSHRFAAERPPHQTG